MIILCKKSAITLDVILAFKSNCYLMSIDKKQSMSNALLLYNSTFEKIILLLLTFHLRYQDSENISVRIFANRPM